MCTTDECDCPDSELVLIYYGIHCRKFAVVGCTVAEIRERVEPVMGVIPTRAVAVIRGEIVTNEHERVVRSADQLLAFVLRASVMGG